MTGQPLPPPSARRPLLTPARYDKVKGKGAKNWASKCSRPNAKVPIPFPNQFPTSVVGYQRPYAPFEVRPYEYQCARPTALPRPQMGMQNGGGMGMVQFKAQLSQLGLGSRGTGVFHAPRELVEYNRTNCSNIKEKMTKQGGDHGGSYQNRRNKNKNGSKGKNVVHEGTYQKRKNKNGSKGKNGGSVKVKKEEECYDPTLPPGINLPMEWTY